MASTSLRLTDLPGPIISNVLWLVYPVMTVNDWLNLKSVCTAFSVEIERLNMSHNALNKEQKSAGVYMFQRRHWVYASLMPTSQYARYLTQKLLHYPGTVNPCFLRMTLHVASVLVQHEWQPNSGTPAKAHQPSPRRYEEVVYLLCKASATTTPNAWGLRNVPLDDLSLNFDTLAASDMDFAVAAGAAYLGMTGLLAGKSFSDSAFEGFHSAAAKVYGEIFSAACRGGYVEMVRMLLERGIVPQPSHVIEAAREGNLEVIKLLSPARSNGILRNRFFALHRSKGDILGTYSISQVEEIILAAVETGHQRIVGLLVPTIKQPSLSFRTKFLAAATQNGHVALTRQAIVLGADINRQDGLCMTPLDNACRNGRSEVAALLLELGASPVSPLEPMNQAAAGGHIQCMKQLLTAGVDINWRKGNFLVEPCSRGSVNALQWLFENGLDITKASGDNIHYATAYATKNGYITILNLLIEHGVDWNIAKKYLNDGNVFECNIHHVSRFLDALEEQNKHHDGRRKYTSSHETTI